MSHAASTSSSSSAVGPENSGVLRGSLPTLRITGTGLHALGAFAEAQKEWLRPDPGAVARLAAELERAATGVVSHFYMDPRLQGVLTACPWPHIHISDSLAMADAAVTMAQAGMTTIAVLGVDFMSENVRAMLDAAGHQDVDVLRVATDPIGCSLAEAALAPGYDAWLQHAAQTPRSLHVVYINTSLLTKARAHAALPTITCTSSNVVQTVLTAFAQVDDLTVWYGPDTYMGRNLQAMFAAYADLPDAEIQRLHPAHDQRSLRALAGRLHVYEQGACVVHHMFGRQVTDQVARDYPDAYHTAHFEVPGEMFALAADAQRRGRGVVGSTSNILHFIAAKVDDAVAGEIAAVVTVVLGTEAGMITPIVRDVQRRLAGSGRDDIAVDIVFPVAADAIAPSDTELGIVPGVAGGEGCSTAGGCATCPYMKMNSLDALLDVLARVHGERTGGDAPQKALQAYRPRAYDEQIQGRTAADLGSQPILHMRAFGQLGRLSDELVADIVDRCAKSR